MNIDVIKEYENKHVRIRKTDNYTLYGTILEIEGDTIIFESKYGKSAICVSAIIEIMEVEKK